MCGLTEARRRGLQLPLKATVAETRRILFTILLPRGRTVQGCWVERGVSVWWGCVAVLGTGQDGGDGTRGVLFAQTSSCSQLVQSQVQAWGSAAPAASTSLRCLPLMKVLLHKAARYVLSLFQLFICLPGCGCGFPLVSATLL